MGAVISRLLRKKKKLGKYGALLLLPNEVLFDAFNFLNRRQLTNLERVCPRFHRIISDHMGETPFLRLNIRFDASLQTFNCNDVEAPFITNLNNFHFLRFDTVFLFYMSGSQSINEKLNLLHNQLQLFKTAFSDLEKITLFVTINQNDQSQFRNHFQLLDHIREQLLPICDSSPFYSFNIDFQSDRDAAGNFIGQILQLPPINRCHEVQFHYTNKTFIQLPVEVISNWLNRDSDDGLGCTRTGQIKKYRFLSMNKRIRIQNTVKMCDRLKMAFTDADSPVHPFLFNFSGGPVEIEVILNDKTNEVLVIGNVDLDAVGIGIKRSAKEFTRN